MQRARGDCRRCRQWRFAAAARLGRPEQATQSPTVQKIAALTVSKMPAPEAQQVVERLTGLKLPAATLSLAARVQGQRTQAKRQTLSTQMAELEAGLGSEQQRFWLDASRVHSRVFDWLLVQANDGPAARVRGRPPTRQRRLPVRRCALPLQTSKSHPAASSPA